MNTDNLHELIHRYESNLDMLYGSVHDELFKWRALKTWQEQWFKPADAFADFSQRFQAAKKDFDLLTDNSRMHPCEDISLIGVEVTSKQYGTGTVIDQKINQIRVKFADVEKSLVLDKKFTARPTFVNDEEIVTAFTEYAAAQEKLRMLYRRLETLR